ncbi:hypothetical protein OY671_010199, partial [Metschnikowia pulcherrima]
PAAARDPVIASWRAAGSTRPWNDPEAAYRSASENEASTVSVAEGGGDTLAGAVMVGFDGHRGWVYYSGVVPGRQQQGIGRSLMTAAEVWSQARDCPKIMFMVRTDNSPTRVFYAASGYEDQAVVTMGQRLDGR